MEMIFGLLVVGTAVYYSKVLGEKNDFSIWFESIRIKGVSKWYVNDVDLMTGSEVSSVPFEAPNLAMINSWNQVKVKPWSNVLCSLFVMIKVSYNKLKEDVQIRLSNFEPEIQELSPFKQYFT